MFDNWIDWVNTSKASKNLHIEECPSAGERARGNGPISMSRWYGDLEFATEPGPQGPGAAGKFYG